MQKIQSLKEMKAAIFDMDGTLTDSAGMWLEARAAFFEAYGIQGTPEQVTEMISMAIDGASRYAIEAFGLTQSLEEISRFWLDYAGRRYATDIPLKPGVKAYFDKLKASGIPICLATGCTLSLAHIALDRHGLGNYFDYEICVDQTGGDKSSPEVFLRCAKHLGLPAGSCAVFEDSETGIRSAFGAGFYTVAVFDAYATYTPETIRESCDLVINSFEELL